MSINEPTGKLARWSLYLQTFEFEIVHRKGAAHLNVDVLSRPVLMVQTRKMAKDGLSNEPSSLPIVRPPQKHVSGLLPDTEADKESDMTFEPHEHDGLIHYLKIQKIFTRFK
jgi:hypothetical protein